MAHSEYSSGAPRVPVGFGVQCCSSASGSNQNVMSPRATKARSYAGQLVIRSVAFLVETASLDGTVDDLFGG